MDPLAQERPKITLVESRPPTLWQQLDPPRRRQLTQQWATMIQKMRQRSHQKEDNDGPDQPFAGQD
jgi:hypothetical protein